MVQNQMWTLIWLQTVHFFNKVHVQHAFMFRIRSSMIRIHPKHIWYTTNILWYQTFYFFSNPRYASLSQRIHFNVFGSSWIIGHRRIVGRTHGRQQLCLGVCRDAWSSTTDDPQRWHTQRWRRLTFVRQQQLIGPDVGLKTVSECGRLNKHTDYWIATVFSASGCRCWLGWE